MSEAPDREHLLRLHERLLEGDPTAPAIMAETVLEPLLEKLGFRHPQHRGSDPLIDAVGDAILDYIKRPGQFDPERAGLLGFLEMAAHRDLLNALAKERRRQPVAAVSLEAAVEVPADDGNGEVESQIDARRLRSQALQLFPDPVDRKLAELILDNVRKTEAFVDVLGLGALPIDEQRREVKRHKDRIKKTLERHGKHLRSQ